MGAGRPSEQAMWRESWGRVKVRPSRASRPIMLLSTDSCTWKLARLSPGAWGRGVWLPNCSSAARRTRRITRCGVVSAAIIAGSKASASSGMNTFSSSRRPAG